MALLLAKANRDFHGLSWGYHFDWQSKSFFLPRGTPTVVCTAYVAHALLEAWEVWGNEEWRTTAVQVADFILCDVHRTEDETGLCFSYSPIDRECVYNASLLGAWLLARLGVLTGRRDWVDEAKQAFSFVIHRQRTDGSWFYGEAEHQRWIDNFHTGFILECLYEYGRLTGDGEYEEALARGVAFYENQLFLSNGAPKYFPHRTYPIDVHACAQGILTFAKLGKREQAEKVLTWTLEHLWNPRGYFYYQKGRFFTNRIPYMRWGQAWMLYALSVYLFRMDSHATPLD